MDEFELELDWVGFELHPETPEGGMAVARLFPAGRLEAAHAHLEQVAAQLGVEIHPGGHLPNTRRALALAEQARDAGSLAALRSAALDAHWLQQRDLEDDAVLADLARAAGLDPDLAVPATRAPKWQARVDAMRAEATRWGVTGIPTCFFLPDGWTLAGAETWTGPQPLRVVGCQPLPLLRDAARRIGAPPR